MVTENEITSNFLGIVARTNKTLNVGGINKITVIAYNSSAKSNWLNGAVSKISEIL
jgi:hypothetical protein